MPVGVSNILTSSDLESSLLICMNGFDVLESRRDITKGVGIGRISQPIDD